MVIQIIFIKWKTVLKKQRAISQLLCQPILRGSLCLDFRFDTFFLLWAKIAAIRYPISKYGRDTNDQLIKKKNQQTNQSSVDLSEATRIHTNRESESRLVCFGGFVFWFGGFFNLFSYCYCEVNFAIISREEGKITDSGKGGGEKKHLS